MFHHYTTKTSLPKKLFCAIILPHRSHSLMDRMPVCGIGDPSSILGESTTAKQNHTHSSGYGFVLASKLLKI